jgi:hypothetical protein
VTDVVGVATVLGGLGRKAAALEGDGCHRELNSYDRRSAGT